MVVLVITHHVHVHGYGHGGSDGWRGGGGGGLGDGGCGGHGGLKKNSRRNLNAFKNKNNPFITRLKLKKLTYSSYVFEKRSTYSNKRNNGLHSTYVPTIGSVSVSYEGSNYILKFFFQNIFCHPCLGD